jgi:PAS domain S-box-containing protein
VSVKKPALLAGDWEGNEFLELAEASAGIGVWDMDLATGLVRGRPQFFRVMGIEPSTQPVSVEVFRSLRHPEDRAKVVDGFQQMLHDGTDYYENEYRIVRPDGQLRWILGRGRVVRDTLGKPVRYFGVDIDITERKRAETELRAAQSRFLSVFQLAPIAMSLGTLRDGRYIDVNAALLAQTGYRREEIVGRTARELSVYVEKRDFERVRKLLASQGKVRGLELQLRGKMDVRTVLFSADIVAFADEQCLLTASVDITDRKAAESALLESEQRYRDLVHNASDIVATVDLQGRFTSINPAVERVLGQRPEELIGVSVETLIPVEERPKHQSMLQRKIEGEGATRYETQIQSKDGRRVTLEVNSKLIRDSNGDPVAIHSISRDITERKDAEARQTLLLRELQHRAKNLLAVVQSITLSTLRNVPGSAAVQATILGRFQALARAQDFVAAGPGGGASLDEIVRAELAPFVTQASIEGPALIARTSFAQMFALVVHELATNATKYGALSTPDGHISIRWSVDGDAFSFWWIERGGPAVEPPSTTGFGTKLINAALDEAPKVSYRSSGLEYAVVIPMEQLRP